MLLYCDIVVPNSQFWEFTVQMHLYFADPNIKTFFWYQSRGGQ